VRPRPPLPPGPFLVVGLARSGIAAALALHHRGAEVVGVDAGSPPALSELRRAGVEVHGGEAGVALLERAGSVVKSPGVPAEAPVIAQARARRLPVVGELELGWRMLGNEFVAVTGTNGKTTTAELIGHVHHVAHLPVAVAGNVGAAVSGLVGEVAEEVTVVCEASSFQLEDTTHFAPEAAVLVNLAPDHLDRHRTFESYVEAKLQVFARQQAGDIAVVPDQLLPVGDGGPHGAERLVAEALRASPATSVSFGEREGSDLRLARGELRWRETRLMAADELRLRGRHNVENAMAAAAACLARGVEAQAVREGLRSFPGVAHRLEEVAARDGVSFVNDSKATNVTSTLVALEAYAGAPVHLILGGQGKGQDFTALAAGVRRGCRAVYLIGEDAQAIAAALAGADVPLHASGSLERAVQQAGRAAVAGDVVLLSPACASFDQFEDFEARGDRFRELARG
jgi:UDP-N-acetylmuramoylalanine--D-glutamate ligase